MIIFKENLHRNWRGRLQKLAKSRAKISKEFGIKFEKFIIIEYPTAITIQCDNEKTVELIRCKVLK